VASCVPSTATSSPAPTLGTPPCLWAQDEPALLRISPDNSNGSSQIQPRLKCSTPTFSDMSEKSPTKNWRTFTPLRSNSLSLPSPQKFVDHHHLSQHPDRGMPVFNASPPAALRCRGAPVPARRVGGMLKHTHAAARLPSHRSRRLSSQRQRVCSLTPRATPWLVVPAAMVDPPHHPPSELKSDHV